MPRFSEIVYERPDLEALSASFEALIAELEADSLSAKEAKARLEKVYADYTDFYTLDKIAELRYYHDITDSFYADECDWFLEHEAEVDQLFERLCSASANCAEAETLDREFWGGWVVDAYQIAEDDDGWGDTLDAEYLSLAQRENAILTEYRRVIAEPTVSWKGREQSFWSLQQDESLSEEEWDQIRARYYDKYSGLLGELYIRLVGVRQEIAAYLGYDSYEAFAWDAFYERDYSPEEGQALAEQIRRELAPLYEELDLNRRWDELSYSEIDETGIFSALKTAVRAMGGTAWDAFQDMEAYELYDIDISDKKGDVTYQCYLGSYENPFIIVKTEGFSDDILSVGHEFGHFVDAWYNYDGTESEDLAEVFSQGMEYLLLSRVPRRYREELTAYKLLDTVDTFTQQASFAAFEHEVYSRPAAEWTPEKLNELSLRLAKDYGYLIEGREDYYAKSWIDTGHFFDSPCYCISYCVSNDAAFRIYEMECAEPGSGLACWNAMLPRDRDGFLETLTEQGGLEQPLGEQSVKQIAASLREKLG